MQESTDKHTSLARPAQEAIFQVNPLDRMGGSHGALIVVAMSEIQRMAEFMDRFFEKAQSQNVAIGRQSIEFLAEAVGGN